MRLNGGAQFPLPLPANNSAPLNASASSWGTPHTARIKLGVIAHDGSSPLVVGKNNFQFNVENAGLLNVHVEMLYSTGERAKLHAALGNSPQAAAYRTAAIWPASALSAYCFR